MPDPIVNPLQTIIDGLKQVMTLQAADPKDPQIQLLLLGAAEMLNQTMDEILGPGDDDNRAGS